MSSSDLSKSRSRSRRDRRTVTGGSGRGGCHQSSCRLGPRRERRGLTLLEVGVELLVLLELLQAWMACQSAYGVVEASEASGAASDEKAGKEDSPCGTRRAPPAWQARTVQSMCLLQPCLRCSRWTERDSAV